uniref:Uncharacterized protein n=1 Tax=Biomphalaria glabrata TaxID=6526 RepID=A0A2C9M9E4_BIOGL
MKWFGFFLQRKVYIVTVFLLGVIQFLLISKYLSDTEVFRFQSHFQSSMILSAKFWPSNVAKNVQHDKTSINTTAAPSPKLVVTKPMLSQARGEVIWSSIRNTNITMQEIRAKINRSSTAKISRCMQKQHKALQNRH